mgnify:CR=1 FL=1
MKTHSIRATLIVVGVALSGCASVDITKTASGYYAPTDANVIDVLKTVPDRKYVELGTVTVSGFDASDVAKMHNAVRTKAAALGADAVILTEEGLISHSFSMERWATGVAIHYVGAQARDQSAHNVVQVQSQTASINSNTSGARVTSPADVSTSAVEPEQNFQSFDHWQGSARTK